MEQIMAYTLTLTAQERRAFDFVGNRYIHGHELSDLITDGEQTEPDAEWDGNDDITYKWAEHQAWAIHELCTDEECQWELFAPELVHKLLQFCDHIV